MSLADKDSPKASLRTFFGVRREQPIPNSPPGAPPPPDLPTRPMEWVLTDSASVVFDKDPDDYIEIELLYMPPYDRGAYYGEAPARVLVKPLLDAIVRRAVIPGTSEFACSVNSHKTYELDHARYPELQELAEDAKLFLPFRSLESPTPSKDPLGDELKRRNGLMLECDPTPRLGLVLTTPVWHDRRPSSASAADMAKAVIACGGRLDLSESIYRGDSFYAPLANALSEHGIVLQDYRVLIYDPPLAQKRLKSRLAAHRARTTKPQRDEAKALKAKRADEQALKTISRKHVRVFLHQFAYRLFTAAVRAMTQGHGIFGGNEMSRLPYAPMVLDAYEACRRYGVLPTEVGVPHVIGDNSADALLVLQTLVAKFEVRTKAHGTPSWLFAYLTGVLTVYQVMRDAEVVKKP